MSQGWLIIYPSFRQEVKKMKSYLDLDFDGADYEIELDIEYSIHGKFIPATYYEPADYPELDIESVTYKAFDLDGNEITITDDLKKVIDAKIDYTILEEECWYDAKKPIDDY